MKKPYIFFGIIALLVIAGTIFAFNRPNQKDLRQQPSGSSQELEKDVKTPLSSTPRLLIGDANAPLGIVQFSDPQCPICKRFFEQTEPQLLREYIDTGKAYLEIKVETHIGLQSQLAGEAWYCAADQNKFKDFHDQTFSRQGKEQFTAELMVSIAAVLGLNREEFDKCLDDGKYRQVVKDSHNESKSRISSTPTFFINDQKVVGAQPFSIFRAVIEAELK